MLKLEINKIYCGDCIKLLQKCNPIRPKLIFADPPFNIGYDYETYQDNLEYDNFVSWTYDWMEACYNVLSDDGSFYIAIGDEYAAEVKIAARKLGLETRNWIIWTYGFGQNTTRKL